MKKILKSEILINLLWSAFGFITSFKYYKEQDYLAAGLLGLIGIAYLYRLLSAIISKIK